MANNFYPASSQILQPYQDLKDRGNITRQAINEAAQSNLPGKEGGPTDAYRHLLWTGEMTRRYGEDTARAFGNFHEYIEGPIRGQRPEHKAMDLANNEVGYGIGRNASSWNDVVRLAREAMQKSLGGTGPTTWLPEDQWRHSDTDPNPAPRDSNGNPLSPQDWNWPSPDWPSDPYPLPKGVPTPPDGQMPMPSPM